MAKRQDMEAYDNQRPPRSRARKIWGRIGKVFGTLLLVGFLTLLVFVCIFAMYIKNDLSEQVDFTVEGYAMDQTSVIYYQDRSSGEWKVLKELYGEENRVWVSYEKIPYNLKKACIAIEDKRFEEHQGVDWLRTIKASANMFLGGSTAYGASTITQQLIKNITHEDEVTVRRKLVEIFRALDYEKKYTKDEILELYLNIIPLGERCFGVQAAAQTYFGKNVEELTLAECASLIGITNNPSKYNPYLNPKKNKERQEIILGEMLDQGYISQSQYQQAVEQELVFVNRSGENDSGDYFSYFEDQVITEVVRDFMEKTDYEYDLALKLLQTGGYKIYCTIDPEVQAAVDKVYQNLENIPDTASSQQLQSAIVVADNATGDIVALAGGVGEKSGSLIWNRATQSRLQPGSILKPISVFAPALEQGLVTPSSVYDDTPYQFTDRAAWPKNSDSTYRGLVSINDALCYSLNTVAVKLVAEMGTDYCFQFARNRFGLSNLKEEYVTANGTVLTDMDLSALALGDLRGGGVTVRDMAAAYGAFTNQGYYREARIYTRVLDSDGKVILDNTQDTNQAMSPTTTWYCNYMMQNAVDYGSGSGAQLENMAVAGKTGTTSNDFDRWFAGYTPYYTAVVWSGYNDPEEIVLTDTTENPSITLWRMVMEDVHRELPEKAFDKPTDVVIATYCADSGLLATDACKNDPRGDRTVTGELYLADVPTQTCNVHRMVKICGASDHVTNEYCNQVPGNFLYEKGLLDVNRVFPIAGITVQDQAYVWPSQPIPAGYHTGVSPEVDSISVECYIHSEEDLPKEEEEEEEEEEGQETNDLSQWIDEWMNENLRQP